ncbi:MAG: tRNA epoxyqueuosine(34) reductase QueG [Chloroflexi bacterium]|nr:tRNA epoxyqueuosine(34) reductase QueG [Chloroflexota bacterium]MBV9132535.1 tRNA epoxyqueuosine(34) reductase QueG [Chloroflexota bacterium]
MSLTSELKSRARELGFHLVGVTSPEPFDAAQTEMERWLAHGHNAEMAWLNAARAQLSTHPRDLLEDARSLVVVGVSYRTEEPAQAPGGRVARYAWGGDYHAAMKSRLKELAAWLGGRSRVFVDDGPLVERDAAIRAGLGFRGKNTNVLTPIGSFVFLGAVLSDVELDFDQPVQKDCGSCRLCIDACPTNALDDAYHLQAERCIAYLTIEHRGSVSDELRPLVGDWVFGCDICQEVCPYNASTRNRPRGWPEFEPRSGTRLDLIELLQTDETAFRERFHGSPIKRTKRRGLVRNAALALGNLGDASSRAHLERLVAENPDPVVGEAAGWALRQLPLS